MDRQDPASRKPSCNVDRCYITNMIGLVKKCEVRGQKSEPSGQRSEVLDQRLENRNQDSSSIGCLHEYAGVGDNSKGIRGKSWIFLARILGNM